MSMNNACIVTYNYEYFSFLFSGLPVFSHFEVGYLPAKLSRVSQSHLSDLSIIIIMRSHF